GVTWTSPLRRSMSAGAEPRYGTWRMSTPAMNNIARPHARERLVDDEDADVSEGIAVGVDLSGLGPDGMVGYRAKRHTGLIDVERRAGYEVGDFWEPMRSRKEQSLILDPGEFYILASKEAVQVPPDYAAEMVPFDPLVGEFRV